MGVLGIGNVADQLELVSTALLVLCPAALSFATCSRTFTLALIAVVITSGSSSSRLKAAVWITAHCAPDAIAVEKELVDDVGGNEAICSSHEDEGARREERILDFGGHDEEFDIVGS